MSNKIYYKNVEVIVNENIKLERGRHYVYKITFPDLINDGVIPFYIGMSDAGKRSVFTNNYIGSPGRNRKFFLDAIKKKTRIVKEIIAVYNNPKSKIKKEEELLKKFDNAPGKLNGPHIKNSSMETRRKGGLNYFKKYGKQGMSRLGKKAAKITAKKYAFISPKGKLVVGRNLHQLSRERKLDQSHMFKVLKGKRKSHKGWTRA